MNTSLETCAELDTVLCIDKLHSRPARAPDNVGVDRAMIELASQLAISPQHGLQCLVEMALWLCRAHSAGISILEEGADGREVFRWHALAGRYAPHINSLIPRDFSPCGTVLDRNSPLLMKRIDRYYTEFAKVSPLVEEVLLVPFQVGEVTRGTIWVVAHDQQIHFDAEDLRIMTELARFAAEACHLLDSLPPKVTF